MDHEALINTPLGRIGLHSDGRCLVRIDWLAAGPERWPDRGLARMAAEVVLAWFRQPGALPELPLAPAPTAFQGRVRAAMLAIPAGCTRTYGDVARELGSSPRAVGGACSRNPLPIIVPCHRIVAHSGLGGYSGDWERGAVQSHKQRLLALEAGSG